MVQEADLVVEGRVLATRCVEDDRGRVVSDFELEVARTFTGEHRERRTVRLPGGMLPSGRGLLVPGLPSLALGERVILALSKPNAQGMRLTTGLSQGKFQVLTGPDGLPQAVRGGVGGTLAGPGGLEETGGVEVMPYAELVARLEAAANAKSSNR